MTGGADRLTLAVKAGAINAGLLKEETDVNMFWVGVLVGMIVCAGPEWLKILIFIMAVLFSGLLVHLPVHGHGHPHVTANPWMLAIGGVGFGVWSWHYARKRGLQHLGAAELNTRWTNLRKISKWGW